MSRSCESLRENKEKEESPNCECFVLLLLLSLSLDLTRFSRKVPRARTCAEMPALRMKRDRGSVVPHGDVKTWPLCLEVAEFVDPDGLAGVVAVPSMDVVVTGPDVVVVVDAVGSVVGVAAVFSCWFRCRFSPVAWERRS